MDDKNDNCWDGKFDSISLRVEGYGSNQNRNQDKSEKAREKGENSSCDLNESNCLENLVSINGKFLLEEFLDIWQIVIVKVCTDHLSLNTKMLVQLRMEIRKLNQSWENSTSNRKENEQQSEEIHLLLFLENNL